MGSRGLYKTGKGAWKLNAKNAVNYNITLKEYKMYWGPSVKQGDKERMLNDALATINRLNNEILGLPNSPAAMPEIELTWGKHSDDAYGDALIQYFGPDKINIYRDALMNSSDTAAHEYVHALTYHWIKNSFNTIDEQRAARNANLFPEAICRNALIRIGALKKGEDFNKTTWKTAAGTVHRFPGDTYAKKNTAETVTTSVQMVLRYGNKASPYAKAVVQELRREAQKQYRKLQSKRRAERKSSSSKRR